MVDFIIVVEIKMVGIKRLCVCVCESACVIVIDCERVRIVR